MDSYEMSKIGGAVCAALLLIVGTRTLIDMRLADHGEKHAAAAHAPDGAKPAAAAGEAKADATKGSGAPTAPAEGAAPAKTGGFDVAKVVSMVGTANADAGKAAFAKCAACHTAEKGAPNKMGPNLWGVIGRAKASIADFAGYSPAMKEKGGNWTFEDLAQFVHSPSSFVPKTKMVFPGLKDAQAVADVLAYIRTLADAPAELPK